ncbi:serine/threonine protein kinase [Nocardioides alpinus]|uniref:Serine/threonine protein kinase n=1 Tax=Nocardioides alpinus TaxID=748909 RepID=A0A1I0WEC5_9ACTN|nr:hypothetical protein [Nocardioides alpinus]PKH37844.1 hypothetical protein CXG46_20860 [Nocardioides alpinus]SFA86520.1 serine/threonine protein kinase [Nocardioides alpinus]
MTTFIVIAVIVLVVLAVAAYVIRQKNRESNIARAEQLRTQAAAEAQSTLPPAQDRAAEAEARAEEARVAAERARAEAEEARVAASQAEAAHESQVRAADRLDPRVDHKADDYAPQVGGTVDQQPTPPSEANLTPEPTTTEPTATEQAPAEPTSTEPTATEPTATEPTATEQPESGTPLLPRRTPGANEMPGKPMESDGTNGGWFTRKDT